MQHVIVVGFGFMGGMHAQVYAQLKKARLVAVVDALRARAQAQADRLGLEVPIYSALSEALAAHPGAIVDICTPTPSHGALVKEALRAGRPVFCEKPLSRTYKEAAELADLAERAGLPMQVGQCIRFWPEYVAFVEFVRKGSAGRLLSLSLQRRAGRPGYSAGDWLNQGDLSGGAALDLHIHDTDFVHHLLGKPEAVSSVATSDNTGISHIFTRYHYRDIAVTAEGGWNYPAQWGFQMAFQAVFEKGAVEYDSASATPFLVTVGSAQKKSLAFKAPKAGASASGKGNISSLGGYFNELKYFVDCLEAGRKPEIATARQGAESLKTVMAEIRSAETGKTVKL